MKKIFANFLVIVGFLITVPHSVFNQEVGSVGKGKHKVDSVLSAQEIAQRFLPGVTLIICDDGKGNYSQGSGFFIAPGMILTNAHVVKGMVRGVAVTGKEQKKTLINAVAYFNSENTDLALLVSDEAKKLKTPILPLAQPNDLSIGETIYVLSNPKGLSGTISQGIVSSGIRKTKKMDLLQITAPISEGSSGGAVMNSRGEVIGIATSSLQSGQNLNFAVPAAQIRLFLEEFADGAKKAEYVSVSKFPGSWIAPKLFLEVETKNNENKATTSAPNTKTAPNSSSNPTLKETTDWISEKLEGTSVSDITENKNTENYERLRFEGCKMYLEGEFGFYQDEAIVKFSYSPNLNILSFAEAWVNKNGDNTIRLNFKKNIVEITAYYYRGYSKTKKPNKIEKEMTKSIVIFTKNKDTAERVANAFNRVIEVCGENTKEPF